MEVINYDPPKTIKAFIRDYNAGRMFYNWIIGPVGPLSADSEFLTPQGWKRMDAYAPGDIIAQWEPALDGDPSAGALRFVKPQDYIVTPATTLRRFRNKHSLSMVLSDCHRLVFYDAQGELREAPAGYVAGTPGKRLIPTAFVPQDRPGTGWSEAVLRLAVAINADGHFPAMRLGSTAAHDACHVTLRKERKKTRLRELLRACGVEFSESTYPQRPTETKFVFKSPYVGKTFEGRWWDASALELEIILDELPHWDGLFETADTRFSTTDKASADFIQYAAHACGGRATIKTYVDPRNPDWAPVHTVHIAPRGSRKAAVKISASTQIDEVPTEDGKQYCFRTASSYFVARHDGRIFITGNSGKTTGIFFKLCHMASLQEPSPDGIRRSRAVIVRNTMPQLKDTTLVSWNYWFKDGQAGTWIATDKRFILRFGDVECEVLFRPLDTEEDVQRVLSLEVTFAIIDEFVQIPRKIIEALAARCGRYPSKKDGGATNWGMWGSSNPDTEDNWWFDYLHGEEVERPMILDTDAAQDMMRIFKDAGAKPNTIRYYHQPSGFSPDAENLDNLPGGRGYYDQQSVGKTHAWIKQFIDAEWGYSISGQPVVPDFNPSIHVANGLRYNPHLPLVVGLDPGLGGSALIFGQQSLSGRLDVLGELTQAGYGARRLMTERLKPFLRYRFPKARVILAPDPAAAIRTGNDERTIVDELKRHFEVSIETNNRLPKRLDAINHFATRLVEQGPALRIDGKECPMLVRALKGGWRYAIDNKKNDMIKGNEPEKNVYSHPGDAFGYLCRYFHRETEREMRYSSMGGRAAIPRSTYGASVHYR